MTRTVRTMCPMNCHPTLCGMQVEVDGDRLVALHGDRENPDSQGFLCVRGRAAEEIPSNPDRVLHPMVRSRRGGDDWQRISWSDALDRIVEGVDAVGRPRVGVWVGHGGVANDYGVFAHAQLMTRLAFMAGFQTWDPSMICWGLGGLGVGLTGASEVHTKEDMSAHSDLVILWGSNSVSQPNTARHVAQAKKRGARIIAIDVRETEACRSAHEMHLVRPGSDAALALGLMHVLIRDDLCDDTFIEQYTVGFDALRAHVEAYPPEWTAAQTGVSAAHVEALAVEYAQTERATILMSGSSMYKQRAGFESSRAISCLPALTGKLGRPGAGLGARHAGQPHGSGLAGIVDPTTRPPGDYIGNQMSEIIDAIEGGRLGAMLLFGTNFVSSFADAARVDAGLAKMPLVVCQDLFMNETIRKHADLVLPATSWLEDVGCKMTATHLYLMDRALPPAGEARSVAEVARMLAERLGLDGFYPWETRDGHIDAVLDHPSTRHATIAALRAEGGLRALDIGHVAHPDLVFPTASGKVEFVSQTAEQHGLPALPTYTERHAPSSAYPLELRMGRSINHFHSFYDHARALPSMAKHEAGPELWISTQDAAERDVADGDPVRIYNPRGDVGATALVTDRIPAGTLWMHDGWPGLNALTLGDAAVPDSATTIFPFSVGQAAYDAFVEVTAAPEG